MDTSIPYYGDLVRKLFLGIAVVSLIGLPIFHNELRIPFALAISAVILVVLAAGLTNPEGKGTAFFDVLVSMFGAFLSEYQAIVEAHNVLDLGTGNVQFFWFNQIIALAFLIALYFAVKTMRHMARGK